MNNNAFELEKQLVILSTPTINQLLSLGKEGVDALTLYVFYYHTAKWQETNQPKATPNYCMKGLGWGEKRFLNADKILRDLKLIEKSPQKDKKGKITGWYVKLNYIWTTNKTNEFNPEPLKTTPVEKPGSGRQGTNALSVSTLNALSVNNNNITNSAEIEDNSVKGKEINLLIDKFKKVNPASYRLFANTNQRKALERLVAKYGIEKISQIIDFLPATNQKKFAPIITTPIELENKLGKLIAFIKQEQNKNNKGKTIYNTLQ